MSITTAEPDVQPASRSAPDPLVLAAVGVTVAAWASAFVAIRWVGQSFAPGPLALGRLLVGAVVLGAPLAVQRSWMAPTRREWMLLVACGLAWFGGCNVALDAAEQHVDSGTTAMLVNTGPILIALAAGALLGEGFPRLAGPGVAQLVEDLAAATATPPTPDASTSLRAVRAARELAAARTWYDHLAGALGVALFDALLAGALNSDRGGLALTPAGRTWFTDLGCGPALTAPDRRPLLRTCLDRTERRPHLAGALGAALHQQLLHRGWTRTSAGSRAVTLTDHGRTALPAALTIELPQPTAPRASRPRVGQARTSARG